MNKGARSCLVAAVVFFAFFNIAGGASQQEMQIEKKPENPYKGARVLVEVLFVEVKLDAIQKSDAGPMNEELPSAARILEIIKDANNGEVKSSAKMAVICGVEGFMQVTNKIDVPAYKNSDSGAAIWRQYNVENAININLDIDSDGKILMEYKISLTSDFNDLETESQLTDVSCRVENRLSLESGTPVVAGGMKSKDKVAFWWILRADIDQESISRKSRQKNDG